MSPGRPSVGRGTQIALVCLVVGAPLVVAVGPAVAAEGVVVGRPQLDVFAPDNRVVGGEELSLAVFVSNAGQITRPGPAQYEERVVTARNVRLDVVTDRFPDELAGNVEVLTGTVPAGTVPQGTAGPFEFRFEFDEAIRPGTYEIPVQLSYDYTRFVEYSDFDEPVYSEGDREEIQRLTVVVRAQPRFDVTSSGPVVTAGDTTRRSFTVTNVGSDTANNATLRLAAGESPLAFTGRGDGQSAQIALGRLEPGASRTVSARLGTPATISPGAYPLTASVDYQTPGGIAAQSDPVSVAVPVGAEQSFAVTNVSDTLQTGQRGTVSGTVVNTGGQTVSNAVVVFPTNATGLRPRASEYAVGTLPPGANASFEFVVDASNATGAGPRVLPFVVRYRNPEDEIRTSAAVDAPVTLDAEQTFAVQSVQSDFQVGASGTLTGRIVNTGNRTVTDAVVVVESGGGLQPRETRYPVGTLEPGDDAPFQFPVDVSTTVEAGPQFVGFRVRYRGGNDEVRLSDPVDAVVAVGPEQSFSLGNVTGTLQAGEAGTVAGTVENTGNRTVTDAVVVFATNGTDIQPRTREVALGTLAPGAVANFSVTADVPRTADTGSRPLVATVRYRDASDELRTSDPLTAQVTVGAEQTFSITPTASALQVDGSGTLTGVVRNTGDRTVSNAVVVFESEGGIQPRETRYPVGTLAPGSDARFRFPVDVSPDIRAGPQFVTFRVRYRGANEQVQETDSIEGTVAVGPAQSFAVREIASSLQAGERGRIDGTVVNTGNQTVTDAVVVFAANATSIEPRTREVAVGTLDPGESAAFSVTADVPRTADTGARPLVFRVRYRNADDEIRTSDPLDASVQVDPEQTFALENTSSTLRVDDTGIVRGTVVNTGDIVAESVVVTLQETGPTLLPRERAYAVGTLAPGERAPVAFRFDVTADAEPGPRLLTVRVRYRGQDRQVQLTDDIDAAVDIGPQRDEFAVTAVNSTVPAGSGEIVTLEVRNRENETLRDVRARLFVDDPLASDSSEAFVPELAPNETATLRFSVSADGSAVRKQYPLLVDFTYEDESGESVLSDTYFVAVDVTDPPAREFPVPVVPLAVAVVVLVLAVTLYVNRAAVLGVFGR